MKRVLFLAALGLVSALALAPGAYALDLSLVCDGSGSVNVTRTDTRTRFDHDGHRRTVNETTTHRRDTAGLVRVEIRQGSGRINVPSQVMPEFHAGSDAGWRPLDQLEITDERISGHFRHNFLSNPSVAIDRTTGSIAIEGLDGFNFAGECRPDSGPRF